MIVLLIVVAIVVLIALAGYLYQWFHNSRGRIGAEADISPADKARNERQLDSQPRTWFG